MKFKIIRIMRNTIVVYFYNRVKDIMIIEAQFAYSVYIIPIYSIRLKKLQSKIRL